MIVPVYFEDADGPVTGLTPVIDKLVTLENATNKAGSAPAVSELDATNAPGWYTFSVVFGTEPWDVETEGLVGRVDGGASLPNRYRYKRICIRLMMLALERLAHMRDWDDDGTEQVYDEAGTAVELELTRTAVAGTETLTPGGDT